VSGSSCRAQPRIRCCRALLTESNSGPRRLTRRHSNRGPLYVRVDVALEIALSSPEGANAVEQAVRDELDKFLHPLTGGRDGTGWDFGRRPHESDLHAAVSAVPGVDHIRSLKIVNPPAPPPGTPELNPVINSDVSSSTPASIRSSSPSSEPNSACRFHFPTSTIAALPTWWKKHADSSFRRRRR
jgi:hypothetical protein